MSRLPPRESGKRKRKRGPGRPSAVKQPDGGSSDVGLRGIQGATKGIGLPAHRVPPDGIDHADTFDKNANRETEYLGARLAQKLTLGDLLRVIAREEHLCSAALFAFGSMYAWLSLLDELKYHLPAQMCTAIAAPAVLSGIVLGLLTPRFFILRHMKRVSREDAYSENSIARSSHGFRSPVPTSSDPIGGASGDFAATLSGGLLLCLGLIFLLLALFLAGLEDYRAFLIRRFTFPPSLTIALLAAPAMILAFLLGMGVSITLSGLHGWRRLSRQPKPRMILLWSALLVGALAAAASASSLLDSSATLIVAPLAAMSASIIAVSRRRPIFAATTTISNWNSPSRLEILDLTVLWTAVLLLGTAAALAPGEIGPGARLGMWTAALSGGLVGMIAAAGLRRLGWTSSPAPYLLLLDAIFVLAPIPRFVEHVVEVARLRLFIVSVGAGGVAAAVAREWGQPCLRIQRTLVWLGVAAAAGLAFSAMLGIGLRTPEAVFFGAALVSMFGMLIAAWLLWQQERGFRGPRLAAAISAIAWLLCLLPGRDFSARSLPEGGARNAVVSDRLLDEVRRLVSTASFVIEERMPPRSPAEIAHLWNVDLQGTTADLIILHCGEVDPHGRKRSDYHRLLNRAALRLVRGGRLVILTPDFDQRFERQTSGSLREHDTARTVYQLEVRDATEKVTAFAIGDDIPELVERNRGSSTMEINLRPVTIHGSNATAGTGG